jgi:hypothetical protein
LFDNEALSAHVIRGTAVAGNACEMRGDFTRASFASVELW